MVQLRVAIVETLRFQLDAGADAVQLFDTWAGDLSPADYREFVAPHVQYIIQEVQRTGGPDYSLHPKWCSPDGSSDSNGFRWNGGGLANGHCRSGGAVGSDAGPRGNVVSKAT